MEAFLAFNLTLVTLFSGHDITIKKTAPAAQSKNLAQNQNVKRSVAAADGAETKIISCVSALAAQVSDCVKASENPKPAPVTACAEQQINMYKSCLNSLER